MEENLTEQGVEEVKGNEELKTDVGWVEKPEAGEYEPEEGVTQT